MIFITGAGGFIGRSLVRAFERRQLPIKLYSGRVNDPLRLREELAGVEKVVHLAGAESRGRTRLLQHVDVEGTERLVEECKRAGVAHIITVSHLGADANSVYPLLRAKGEQERVLRSSGLPFTILRSATLFGKDDRFLNVIASLAAWTWPLVWLPGRGRVALQPLWVEDLARCLVAAAEAAKPRNRILEVAGEERFRYEELVWLVLQAAGLRRTRLPVHLRIVRPISAVTMAWWRYPPVSRFTLDRFSVPDVADLDNVLRYFGFRPERLLDNIIYLRRRNLRRNLFSRP